MSRRPLAAVAVGVGAAFGVLLVLLEAVAVPRALVLAVDDGAQLAAVAGAALACARAARREGQPRRREWLLLAAGLGCWTAGQVLWTIEEVVLGREVPFPSWPDAGFLGFTCLASIGLFGWLRGGHRAAARWRDILDGAVIATSLLAVSWVTVLSAGTAGADDLFTLALSLAYPVGDVVMATLVLLTLSRVAPVERATLVLLATGLGGLALADSAYVYLVITGRYGSGDLLSAGWVTGFLLIAAAARCTSDADQGPTAAPPATAVGMQSGALLALPYVPLAVAGVVVVHEQVDVPGAASAELGLGILLVLLVLGRQLVALGENRSLVAALQRAHDDVRRQSMHDSLTGLANRVLFNDRLEHALAVERDAPAGSPQNGPGAGATVSVLYCDLDGFKAVNDEHGHDLGDELLRQVAARLLAQLGPGDTVARLGGDEFAVLLEASTDPLFVAERLVDAVRRPFQLAGRRAVVSLSVGVASVTASDGLTSTPSLPVSRQLLRDADRAMYAAKSAGKGRAMVAEHVRPAVAGS
ncbi:GGDEF domain-containing protein [Cellulomonas aerilata]|uniref:GGDEF domain-containing protein n=1 Tax=Cellulomonas aerilata TaxID=515326 RepID=A0A512DE94_9CELL|nr:GGDEF domain-containing protein [Cellulomonas aerilata]GEO34778.1 hypothetical protein CAE01nite_25030 [Cellulomonas aerilata]